MGLSSCMLFFHWVLPKMRTAYHVLGLIAKSEAKNFWQHFLWLVSLIEARARLAAEFCIEGRYLILPY